MMSELEATRRAIGVLLATCSWATLVGCQAEERVESQPPFQSLAIQRASADKIMRTIGKSGHNTSPAPTAINKV